MFQFEASAPKFEASEVDDHSETSPRLSHKAFLAWGEHCVECAMPACYETCDLFDATPSLKCRRFLDGIVPNTSVGKIPGGEVRFRKWAKLETQGNAAMLPAAETERYERILSKTSAPLSKAGRLIHKLGGAKRWLWAEEAIEKKLIRRFRKREGGLLPDVFLAEITNPTDAPINLILTAYIDKRRMTKDVRSDQLPAPAIIRLEANPGFSRHELLVDTMQPIFASKLPFNLSLVPESDGEGHLVFHRLDLGKKGTGGAEQTAVVAKAGTAKAAKLVVFDLDNTLWKGVLLEGEVEPLPGLRDLFAQLDERGILISIASKNAREDAMAKLEDLGLTEYLLFPQVGWNPKSESVNKIVETIDIGSDTVIFVDDNPFERQEVEQAVAGVEVLPETAVRELLDHVRLQGSATAESRRRRRMYQEAVARKEVAEGFGDDYLEFLKTCEIVTTIRRDKPEDFDRIAELVQRTNQLNFSGRKYGREETRDLLADPEVERYVIDCEDRFGSYGTVGFCLVSRKAGSNGKSEVVIVDDFMLSCRVQGKFIEQAILYFLAEKDGETASRIEVNFRKTERNKAAQMVLEKLGFEAGEGGAGYARDYAKGDFEVDFMAIRD